MQSLTLISAYFWIFIIHGLWFNWRRWRRVFNLQIFRNHHSKSFPSWDLIFFLRLMRINVIFSNRHIRFFNFLFWYLSFITERDL